MDAEDNLIGVSLAWAIIIILPYVVFGFNSFVGWTTIPDLVDIFLYTPVMGVLLYNLYKLTKGDAKLPKWLEYLTLIILFIHFEGHGFHWAANAIDVLTERENVVGVVHNVAYFLDEIVSHIVYFSTLILFFFLLSYIQYVYNPQEVKNKLKVIGSGIFFSFVYTISMIEGQYILYGMALAAIYAILIGYLYTKKKDIVKQSIILFFLIYSVFVFVWSGVYIAIFGSLKQPSEIF